MFGHNSSRFLAALCVGLLAACGSTPYTPVADKAEPVDVTAYAPKVDSFVVLLDTSSSMQEDYQERPKSHTARDLVASFNSAVPPMDFQAALVTFGKASLKCFRSPLTTKAYGLSGYSSDDFATALGALDCTGGRTPLPEAVDDTTQLLSSSTGPVAVFIVSDFQWLDTSAVEAAVTSLKAQHGSDLCLHTVKVGDNTTGDALIADITNAAGCDSAVAAADIASASAMGTYVTQTLMAPLQYEKHTVSATALFDFDKAVLHEQGIAELHNLDERIKSKGTSVGDIDVIGHTDSVGSQEYNQDLSVRRALAVKDYMVSEGIDTAIIDVSGKGESQPAASNDTQEGRTQNRRVEIHVGTSRPTR